MLELLVYEPSSAAEKGGRRPASICVYNTREELDSSDSTEHLDYLIKHLPTVFRQVRAGNEHGFEACVSVFWESSCAGGSGPNLEARQMRFLGELGIGMWFDFWGHAKA